MTDTAPEPQDLADCTLWTRRDQAAAAFAAGTADRIESVDTAWAMALLCGWGAEGLTEHDVRLNMLHTAARWTAGGDNRVYRTPDGLITTPLAPAEDWEPIEGAFERKRCWSVLGAGLASTEDAARVLAVHAWVLPIDQTLLADLPIVFTDRTVGLEGLQAGAFVRARGNAAATVDQAYGLLRASGLPIGWETLAAAAIGLATPTGQSVRDDTEEE